MKIHYIQPWRSDKNIGRANNKAIELIPDGDWICLTDGDSQWLLPNWGELVERVVAENGKDFGVIGCMTNRLNGLHQCYNGEFSENFDVVEHFARANDCWEEHGTKVDEVEGVAGMCLIFSKETWKLVRGFRERTIMSDSEFCRAVRAKGLKIGLARGLYRFHSYRIWEAGNGRSKAQQSIKHLR